jgi:hypothetical protein
LNIFVRFKEKNVYFNNLRRQRCRSNEPALGQKENQEALDAGSHQSVAPASLKSDSVFSNEPLSACYRIRAAISRLSKYF